MNTNRRDEYYRILKAMDGWARVRDGLQLLLETGLVGRTEGGWMNTAEYELDKCRNIIRKIEQEEGAL